ncbi:somatostatin-1-like [Pholidichthys leucotaenia]
MKMLSSSSLRCLLLLLAALTASISCSPAAQRDSKLRLLLQRNPQLSSTQAENEALEEDNFPLAKWEPKEAHMDPGQAANIAPQFDKPQKKKQGKGKSRCIHFFWKTFNPC